MKITIIAFGSQGDVQPAIALGVGLQKAGHKVKLASYAPFQQLATSYGLQYKLVRGDILAFMENAEAQDLMASGRSNLVKLIRNIHNFVKQDLLLTVEDVMEACRDADVLIAFSAAFYVGASIIEQTGQPLLVANLQPMVPTRSYSNALLPPPKFNNGHLNLISHHLTLQIIWQMLRPVLNEVRQEVQGLPPWPVRGFWDDSSWEGQPILHGYSRHILPCPPDWPANVHITGYWFLEHSETWQPPPALVEFLEGGPPPVYVGFGSMKNRNPQEMSALVIRALDMAGQRGILLSGWGGLKQSDLPHTVFMVESIPHDWLFPLTSAVVHHGGAGTTAAGLKAGVPSIIIPHIADQPYWGHHIHRLGLGPKPIRRSKLDAPKLAAAIRTAVTDLQMQKKAAELGQKIRAENGVGTAVEIFTQFIS